VTKTKEQFNQPDGIEKNETELPLKNKEVLNSVEIKNGRLPSTEAKEECHAEKAERISTLRDKLMGLYGKDANPVPLDPEDKTQIERMAVKTSENLNNCYKKDFGIFPSGNPKDSFYNTLWSRDLAHAGGNFFAQNNTEPILDSLKTVFAHQKENGALPYRVEKKRFLLEHTPRALLGIDINILKKIGIDLITRKKARAVYEGEDGGNAEDTIPSIVVTLGELFIYSEEGIKFVKDNYDKIKLAMDSFEERTDKQDGLEISKEKNPDWADSLLRGNKKISTINIWYTRALRMMELISSDLGKIEESKRYRALTEGAKESVLEKLYDKENHYFRTGEGENRIDAAASVFGCLYLLPATEAARVEETMKKKLTSNSGLRNFYPPYPKDRIDPTLKLIGMGKYHNECVWPWVTAQNIQVKIKIALEHPDKKIQERYKKEAVEDLLDLTKLFEEAGGAYEVFDPDTRGPATKLRTGVKKYKVPKNLMGNLAAYQSAYHQLKKLGWI